MNNQRMVEELAKIDGFTKPYDDVWYNKHGSTHQYVDLHDYLTSHDAMQRLIDGLDEDQLNRYRIELQRVIFFGGGEVRVGDIPTSILLAKSAQKAEALLKALGLWSEECFGEEQDEDKSI